MGAVFWISGLISLMVVVFVVWFVLLETSIVVEPGTLVLLLKRGAATDRALGPGRHFMQPWRKAMVEVYPSRELALVAGGLSSADERVDNSEAPLRLHLGDKTFVTLSYTVRCQLDPTRLKDVHNQYGPEGIWSALRDITRASLIAEAGSADVTVEDAFGDRFAALEQRLEQALDVVGRLDDAHHVGVVQERSPGRHHLLRRIESRADFHAVAEPASDVHFGERHASVGSQHEYVLVAVAQHDRIGRQRQCGSLAEGDGAGAVHAGARYGGGRARVAIEFDVSHADAPALIEHRCHLADMAAGKRAGDELHACCVAHLYFGELGAGEFGAPFEPVLSHQAEQLGAW